MSPEERILFKQSQEFIELSLESELKNNDVKLALKTVKLCTVSNAIDYYENDDGKKITNNPYALIDYAIYISYFFRLKLSLEFSEEFANSYFGYTGSILCTCFEDVYNIPSSKTMKLIYSRATQYEKIVQSGREEAGAEFLNFFVQCIEEDLIDNQVNSGITQVGAAFRQDLFTRLKEYSMLTYKQLEKYEHQLLSDGEQISLFDIMNDQESSSSQDSKTTLSAKGSVHLSQKVAEAETKSDLEKKRKSQSSSKKEKRSVSSVKNWFTEKLGIFGMLLYFGVLLFLGIFPFVMIDVNFIVELILMLINMFFPVTSIVFWIWGLVCAINGPQDVFAIIYYVSFAVLWVPSFICRAVVFVSSIFSRK